MVCEKCGKTLKKDAKFCSGCGEPVPDVREETKLSEEVAEVVDVKLPEAKEKVEDIAKAVDDVIKEAEAPKPEPPRTDIKAEDSKKAEPVSADLLIEQKPAKKEKLRNPETPLGVGSFIGIMVLLAIPVVNVICVFKWAFSRRVNINKRHYAWAAIVLFLLSAALSVALMMLFPDKVQEMYDLYITNGILAPRV